MPALISLFRADKYGGELSLGFSWPLVGPGAFPGPDSRSLGIGATNTD